MIELFLFSWGSESRRYTTHPQAVNWNQATWESVSITRGQVKLDASLEGQTVSIDCDVAGDVPGLFKTEAPYETVNVTIYRGDESNLADTIQSIWMGEIAKISFGPSVAALTCSPTISLGRGRLPIGRFSVGCRWQLYSRACGLELADWEESFLIRYAYPTQNLLRVTDSARYSPDELIGGFYVDPSGEKHLIIDCYATGSFYDVLFDRWPSALDNESIVMFAPGCDHSLQKCKDFLNVHNFGGFPAIPTKS